MLDITVVILTYNEEKNITECINSVSSFAKRIIVVDSYSTDKTVDIALKLGTEVYQNTFINQAQQYKWAMEHITISTKWTMRLDADERFTSAAANELNELLNKHSSDNVNGIVLRFEVSFLGKKLKHGGIYPFRKLSVYKTGYADIENKEMDEHFYLLSGKSVLMKNDCKHEDYKDIYAWIEKHNKYSSREANDVSSNNTYDKNLDSTTKSKNVVKYGFYYKLPAFLRAKIYYWYRLFIKFAWLDGKEGKIFAYLQAYWYRYLVDVKIYEKQKEKGGVLNEK